MQNKKQVIFQEVGEFVLKQKIECYVLNGLDFNSSKCGRDLDLYCESYEHKRLILDEFKIILERRRDKVISYKFNERRFDCEPIVILRKKWKNGIEKMLTDRC
jgi:hypothetical protein